MKRDDRRERRARQDHDRRDGRPRAARRRARPGLPDRRRAALGAARTPPGATGEWVVVEADESDRSFLKLAPRRGRRHQRRARPPRDLREPGASSSEAFARVRASRRSCACSGPGVRPAGRGGRYGIDAGDDCAPRRRSCCRAARASRSSGGAASSCAVPGRHNVLNALAALAACRAAGVRARRRPRAALADFSGAGRRFEPHGTTARRRARLRRLRPPPDRGARHARGGPHARRRAAARRLLPAAPVLAHASCSRASSARALALADVVVVLDVYRARERAGGLPGRDRAAGRRGGGRRAPAGGRSGGCPTLDEPQRMLARRAAARATCS